MFWIDNILLSLLTLIILAFSARYAYLIAREINIPTISTTFKQIGKSHLQFLITNHSKVETESFGKILAKTHKGIFEFKGGFYGSGHPWILQPFMVGNGHFDLKNMLNEKNEKLDKFIENNEIKQIQFIFYLKYRKFGKGKWIKHQPQKWIYDFKQNLLWLNV